MGALLSAFVAQVLLISYRDIHAQGVLPLPSDFVAAGGIYGALGLIPESGQKFAAAVGWTLVLANYMNLWNPANPTNILGKAAPLTGAGTQSEVGSSSGSIPTTSFSPPATPNPGAGVLPVSVAGNKPVQGAF